MDALTSSASQHADLVRQASIWVSQTFYGTMLKQMHNSPFKSELFSGGRGGEMFASLLDQHLTQRMSRGAAAPLVNSIVKHIERNLNARQDVTTASGD